MHTQCHNVSGRQGSLTKRSHCCFMSSVKPSSSSKHGVASYVSPARQTSGTLLCTGRPSTGCCMLRLQDGSSGGQLCIACLDVGALLGAVYVKDRPAPIPLSQHEERRKKKDFEELCLVSGLQG
jgi:hypothetical protein